MHVGGVGTEGGIGAGGEVFCFMRFLASIDHGSRSGPTAAMRPYSRLLSVQQSTNILGNRLVTLKLEKVIINNVYSASPRHDASANHRARCLPITMAVPPM